MINQTQRYRLSLLIFVLVLSLMLINNYTKDCNVTENKTTNVETKVTESKKDIASRVKVQEQADDVKLISSDSMKPFDFGQNIFQQAEKVPKSPLDAIWEYVYQKKYTCAKQPYLGGKREDDVDGAYYLCEDKKLWPFPNILQPPCLVYSFGISWDFKFDDAIAATGCEVHAFDPSMDLAEGTRRKSGVIFHKVGVAPEDSDHGFNGWKMRTLKTLMKELGHQHRSLDYLKVDTDKDGGTGFEDTVMKELLKTGLFKCIRQYAMEIHMPGPKASKKNMDRCKLLYSQMKSLEKAGFRLYETVDNIRYRRNLNPAITQEKIRREQSAGKRSVVLWESHFVNVQFKGACANYL